MKKFIVGCAISTSLLAFSSIASAQDPVIVREGSVFTKIAVQGLFPTGSNKTKDAAGNVVSKIKFKNAVGAELSATYFFTEAFSTEFGVSYTQFKMKKTSGDNAKIKTNSVPVTLMLQFHTPTYSIASPYIGTGYSYIFTSKKGKISDPTIAKAKVKDAYGPVVQIGSNFDFIEGVGLNLDVKQYWFKPKYVYTSNTGVKTTNKYKVNPTVVSLGLTFKF